MQGMATGAGLAALGFWIFIAAVVAAGIWDNIRKRDAQHETLRRIIESGQPVDEGLTDKVLDATGDSREAAVDLKVAGLILVFIAPGLALMGWIMSLATKPVLFMILLGVAALVGFVSLGLFAAAHVVERHYMDVGNGPGDRTGS
jgi:Flp pilus assembly protein TadB